MSQGTYQETLTVETPGRRAIELTSEVHRVVSKSGLEVGLVNLFVHHTSASLMIQENADPDVLSDTESFFTRLVPMAIACSFIVRKDPTTCLRTFEPC